MGLCISKNPPSYKNIKDIPGSSKRGDKNIEDIPGSSKRGDKEINDIKNEDIKHILKNNFKDIYEIKYFIDLVIIINKSTGKIQYLKKGPSKEQPNVHTWNFF
jgi:hypothetical protein